MSGKDVADASLFDAPIQLHVMDSGNAENHIDATGLQPMR
jgi:hypothetical protein